MRHFCASLLCRLLTPLWCWRIINKRQEERRRQLIGFVKQNLPDKLNRIERIISDNQKCVAAFSHISTELLIGGLLRDGRLLNNLVENITSANSDYLEHYRSSGCIGLSFHFGLFHLLPIYLIRQGFDVFVLVRGDAFNAVGPVTVEQVNSATTAISRQQNWGRLVFLDSFNLFSLVQMAKKLKKGGILLIHPDTIRSSSQLVEPVTILQTRWSAHVGIAKLIKATQFPVLSFMLSWTQERPHLIVESPTTYCRDNSESEILQGIYQLLEKRLRNNPDQWIQADFYPQLIFEEL